GPAVGFGAELALACDLRMAATSARIGFVEITRGLFPTNGVLWLLPRLVGHGNAVDLLLSGELVGAERAHEMGLVSRVALDAELLDEAAALARSIASGGSTTLRLLKRQLRRVWTDDLPTTMAAEVDGMLACLADPDTRTRMRAFVSGSAAGPTR
ncbi:MAG: enoyl-CoA hydratase/isomerase family protein, partial [Dermatophilaceae bacterium]